MTDAPTITAHSEAIQSARARAEALPTADQLKITEAARNHIKSTMKGNPSAIGLRVGVQKSGCSGFGYLIDFAEDVRDDDLAFGFDDLTVIADADSMPMIKGSTLDFVTEGLSRMLHFDNPNVEDSCGCGESFTVKE